MNIIVYSKDKCQQCDIAKMLLDMKGQEYTVKKLDEDFTQEELKALFPTARSFPIIVINGNYIGGYSELKQKLSST
jgi:glutaredoxin 3